LWGLKNFCQFGTPSVPGFFKAQKYGINDNAYEHSDFTTGGENICRSKTDVNQPLTGMKRGGRGTYVG
jgi:hypothetical protein